MDLRSMLDPEVDQVHKDALEVWPRHQLEPEFTNLLYCRRNKADDVRRKRPARLADRCTSNVLFSFVASFVDFFGDQL